MSGARVMEGQDLMDCPTPATDAPAQELVSIHKLKRAYVEGYGCSANTDDLEIMLAFLAKEGYEMCSEVADADLLLINTCGVKKATEDRILHRLATLSSYGKPLIVAGCLPKINLQAVKKCAPRASAILDPSAIELLPEAIRSAEGGKVGLSYLSAGHSVRPRLERIRLNPFIETVQINQGCLGGCYFCGTKIARGTLRSYEPELIIGQAKAAMERGAFEIHLTSQDTGAYGRDIGYSLPDLVKDVSQLDGDFMIRVGMLNPIFGRSLLHDLIEAFKSPKIFKFLHIPVQSGSDRVLESMNRGHSVEDFEVMVIRFRAAFPDITIATDIIVGYPTETREDFQETIDLIERVRPDVTNISKFGRRPGTVAARMPQLPAKEVNERSAILAAKRYAICLESNRKMIGRIESIYAVDENPDGTVSGRSHNYKIVNIVSGGKIGTPVPVKVLRAHPRHLEGVAVA